MHLTKYLLLAATASTCALGAFIRQSKHSDPSLAPALNNCIMDIYNQVLKDPKHLDLTGGYTCAGKNFQVGRARGQNPKRGKDRKKAVEHCLAELNQAAHEGRDWIQCYWSKYRTERYEVGWSPLGQEACPCLGPRCAPGKIDDHCVVDDDAEEFESHS